jgi:tRNA dimethylallyltransferase
MNSAKILILGVTGSGKGRLAFEVAQKIEGEIISVDSMKVYRRMDIGTAKPPNEAQKNINYHLIDIVEPSESFSVALFVEKFHRVAEQIQKRSKLIVAVGGTALYIKALIYGLFEGPGRDEKIRDVLRTQAAEQGLEQLYRQLEQVDPLAAVNIHPNDAKRIIRALEVFQLTGKPISTLQRQWNGEETGHGWTIIGLRREKADVSGRINQRVKKMISAGLVDEVRSLLSEEKALGKQARCAIGYSEIIEHIQKKTPLEDAVEVIKKNTRRLAKSQRTWFKTFKNVTWLDIEAQEPLEMILERTMELVRNTG